MYFYIEHTINFCGICILLCGFQVPVYSKDKLSNDDGDSSEKAAKQLLLSLPAWPAQSGREACCNELLHECVQHLKLDKFSYGGPFQLVSVADLKEQYSKIIRVCYTPQIL